MTEKDKGNVALAGAVFEALHHLDPEELVALADPEVEWHSFFAQLGAEGVYRGHDGTRRYIGDLRESFENIKAEVEAGIEAGDVAVLVGHIHYRGKGSGVEAETPTCWMFKFRNEKVLCFRAFRDPPAVLEAIGRAE